MSPEQDAEGREAVEPLVALVGELQADARILALTHSSWAEQRTGAWGRLAFLGDSVLGLAVAEYVFESFPRSDIGRLTKIHGQVVSGRACAEVAVLLGVPEMLHEVRPPDADDVDAGIAVHELVASERAMASIVESLIGACYLELGLERTAEATLAAFKTQIELASGTLLDFKSALQEQLARSGKTVAYEIVEESGPPHNRLFRIDATVAGEILGTGVGSSKKAAEQAAAEQALEHGVI